MRKSSRMAVVAGAVALLVLAGACSKDTDRYGSGAPQTINPDLVDPLDSSNGAPVTEGTTEPRDFPVLTFKAVGGGDIRLELNALIRRLNDAGIPFVEASADTDWISVTLPDKSRVDDVVAAAENHRFALRPVRADIAGRAPVPSSKVAPAPGGPTLLPPCSEDTIPSDLCSANPARPSTGNGYELGPAGIVTDYGMVPTTGDSIDTAKATQDPGTGMWGVDLTIKPNAQADFDQLLDACLNATPTCPRSAEPSSGLGGGRIAFLFDDEVLAAPVVMAPHLAEKGLRISGLASKKEAERIALALTMAKDPLPAPLQRSS